MEPTEDDDPEDIFHDALASVFGDVAVSHGEPGKRFYYNSPHGYLPSAPRPLPSTFSSSVVYLSEITVIHQCMSGLSLFA